LTCMRELSTPPPSEGCKRWPKALRLRSSAGELVPGRCRATNLCRYCQRLYVMETVEMLTLDAMEHAPGLWVVLTAREHLTRAECRRHLEQVKRSLRKRWSGVEWFVQVEFQRRGALHLNLLVKGVPTSDADELEARIGAAWCARVDAEPVGQWVGVVEDGVGVVRYISKMLAHGLKAEQAPPLGWRGHRTSQTRGYLVRPASVMRAEAREALRLKRAVWRAEGQGLAGADALQWAEWSIERDDRKRWELVALSVDSETGEVERVRTLQNREPTTARYRKPRLWELPTGDLGRSDTASLDAIGMEVMTPVQGTPRLGDREPPHAQAGAAATPTAGTLLGVP